MTDITPEQAREQWVKVLRSGDYKQGKHQLGYMRDGEKFHCCLGVACELFGEVKWVESDIESEDAHLTLFVEGEQDLVLSEEIKQILGLIDEAGPLKKNYQALAEDGRVLASTLSGLNDRGYTFEQIADVIERGGIETVD